MFVFPKRNKTEKDCKAGKMGLVDLGMHKPTLQVLAHKFRLLTVRIIQKNILDIIYHDKYSTGLCIIH